MKKRIELFDNYKGLLIFLVVFGHLLYPYALKYPKSSINSIFVFIYLFHMPCFIFISGYFSKSDKSKSKQSLLKLLIYYLIFNSLMMILLYFLNKTKISFLSPYNSYWYILSLLFWRLIIDKINNIKYIIPITIIISLLIGFWPEFSNLLSIRRTICFLPFFLLGYKFSLEKFKEFLKKISADNIVKKILFTSIFILYCGFIFMIVKNKNFTMSHLLMGKYNSFSDLYIRIFIFINAVAMIYGLILLIPNKKVKILSHFGKYSLLIYLGHRLIVCVINSKFKFTSYNKLIVVAELLIAIILCLILSSKKLNNFVTSGVEKITDSIINKDKLGKKLIYVAFIIFIGLLMLRPIKMILNSQVNKTSTLNSRIVKTLNKEKKSEIDDALKISYVGDLILLKDQVTSAYNEEKQEYDFSDMFKYTKKYFDSSDISFGVFEGPTAGNKRPYSTSNFGDGLKLSLNFPDEFAKAVSESGIDVVSTANNHLLDNGISGAIRTLDVLDKYNIKHTGSYRNQQEKDELLIVEKDGVKIAVLSYLNFINNNRITEVYKNNPYITSYMPYSNNKYYNEMYNSIKADFKKAKDANADIIVVMAHMGTQFSHSSDAFQNKWNKIFADLGADIVFGDHAHAVQPLEYIGNTLVVNCPGNFANSYVAKDGDATSIVDVYIDKKEKNVIAADVIPMYTQEYKTGYFRALPIYDIYNDKDIYNSMSKAELTRIEKVQNIVTKVMINNSISINNIRERYYYIDGSYYSQTRPNWVKKYKSKQLYKEIKKSPTIVFIGDSITEGTKNNFHPWYEPMIGFFENKKIINISKGGYTTKNIIEKYSNQILSSNGDLYIVALGTNDIRYRNEKTCAMTAKEYIKELKKIASKIKKANSKAKIVFISPWMSLPNDTIAKVNEKEKNKLFKEYDENLKSYCNKNKYLYINPNKEINSVLTKSNNINKYMVDFIHPNEEAGIKLYSESVLLSSK